MVNTFREREGRTFVVPRAMVETLGFTQYEFPCRMITLEVHSSLAAVGEDCRVSQIKCSLFWRAVATPNVGENSNCGGCFRWA